MPARVIAMTNGDCAAFPVSVEEGSDIRQCSCLEKSMDF
jgi:hypothetical protein